MRYVAHPSRGASERPAAWELARTATRWWQHQGRDVVEIRGNGPEASFAESDDVEFAVSLGGDGTMLRTVELVLASRVPVLGVNLGRMGYLTAVEPAGIEQAFERMLAGDYLVEERMALEVELTGSVEGRFMALNDAISRRPDPGTRSEWLLRSPVARFSTYVADGILVSTPTGSTAYNLSARGPVVSPRLRAMVLTPVSPHMPFDRSLVLEPGSLSGSRSSTTGPPPRGHRRRAHHPAGHGRQRAVRACRGAGEADQLR